MTISAVPTDVNGVPVAEVLVPGTAAPIALRGTTSTTTDGNSNTSAGVCVGHFVAQVYLRASAAATTTGNSGDLTVDSFAELAVDANITAVSGTSPTIVFALDRKGADGIYYPIWTSSTVSTSPTQVSNSIGSGFSTNQSFGNVVRFRWTIGGTSPSWTFSVSILGK